MSNNNDIIARRVYNPDNPDKRDGDDDEPARRYIIYIYIELICLLWCKCALIVMLLKSNEMLLLSGIDFFVKLVYLIKVSMRL